MSNTVYHAVFLQPGDSDEKLQSCC